MTTTEVLDGEVIDQENDNSMILSGSEALSAYTSAEIDMQISTAKKYPRSVKLFKQQCEQLACIDEDTAKTMFYSLPRGGKVIQGPSVRFAEVVGYSWGNLRYAARVTAVDDKFITAQGMCQDLEKNIAGSVEVKRRITDKYGKRYNDDMIVVTGNAACSIALRNAIFKVVPFGMAKAIYEKVLEIVKGDAKSLVQRRSVAIEWFLKAGATESQVLQAIERETVDEVTLEDLVTLTGLRNAIKDGESSIEEALGPVPDKSKRVKRSDLNDQLKPAAKQPDSNPIFLDEIKAAAATLDSEASVTKFRDEYHAKAQRADEHDLIDAEASAASKRIAGTKGKQTQKQLA